MKRNIFYNSVLLLLSFLAVSCSSDIDDIVDSSSSNDDFWSQFDFVLAKGADTRVEYSSLVKSTFEAGDVIGVYVVDKNKKLIGGQPTNVRYVVHDVTDLSTGDKGQALVPENPFERVVKNTNYRYVLYYPYNVNMTFDILQNYTHTVDLDQNAAESMYDQSLTAFEHSDFLWCYYTPESSTTTFTVSFRHIMAQVVVDVENADEDTEVYLLNMPIQAYGIKLLQDKIDYNVSVPKYVTDGDEEANPQIHACKYSDKEFRAVVPKHTVSNDKDSKKVRPVVRVVRNGTSKDYTLEKEKSIELSAEKIYTFKIKNN